MKANPFSVLAKFALLLSAIFSSHLGGAHDGASLKAFMSCYSLAGGPRDTDVTGEHETGTWIRTPKPNPNILLVPGNRSGKKGLYVFTERTIYFYPFHPKWLKQRVLLERNKSLEGIVEKYGVGYPLELRLSEVKHPFGLTYAIENETVITPDEGEGPQRVEKIVNGKETLKARGGLVDKNAPLLTGGDALDKASKGEFAQAIASRLRKLTFKDWRSILRMRESCSKESDAMVRSTLEKLSACKKIGQEVEPKKAALLVESIDRTAGAIRQEYSTLCLQPLDAYDKPTAKGAR